MRPQGRDDRAPVSYVYVEGTVAAAGPTGDRIPLTFLVDSGAHYTVLPHEVWQRLGLRPKRRLRLVLADGKQIERTLSECHLEIEQGEGHTPVVLGEPGDVALLGVITIEQMGYVINPFDRTIRPIEKAFLMRVA